MEKETLALINKLFYFAYMLYMFVGFAPGIIMIHKSRDKKLLLEICGIPLLYLEQNSAGFVLPILGTVLFSIALIIVYTLIVNKNKV